MGEMRNAYKILVGKTGSKRSLYRDQWWAIVNMAMNLQVL
jgi:hypothetical protein